MACKPHAKVTIVVWADAEMTSNRHGQLEYACKVLSTKIAVSNQVVQLDIENMLAACKSRRPTVS